MSRQATSDRFSVSTSSGGTATIARWKLANPDAWNALAFLNLYPTSSWLAVAGGVLRGVLGMRISNWDTEFWGVRFATLDHLVTIGAEPERRQISASLLRAADAWCEEQRLDFCSARMDAHDVTSLQVLEDHGFRYIETTIENCIELSGVGCSSPEPAPLRPSRMDDEGALAAIAEDAFLTHRFYADAGFPRHRVDAMYREMVATSLRDPGTRVLVLEAGGLPRGFIVYRLEDLSAYYGMQFAKWRLAALAKNSRGQGYGTALFHGALEAVRGQVQVVDSGLTARNLRSLNLHTRVGFRTTCCSVTLHRWRDRAGHATATLAPSPTEAPG
jgi:GNAT superfamily N-acetyltransferase